MSRWFSFIDIMVSSCRKLPQQQTAFLVQRLSFRCDSGRRGWVLKALSVWSRLSSGSSMWRGVVSPAASQMLNLTACLHTAWRTLTDTAPGSVLIIRDYTLQMFRDCCWIVSTLTLDSTSEHQNTAWGTPLPSKTNQLTSMAFKMHWWHKYVRKQLNVFMDVKTTRNK